MRRAALALWLLSAPALAAPAEPQAGPQIARLEVEIVNLSGALEEASAAGQVERVTELGAAYTRAEADLEALMLQWEELLVSD